MNMKKSIAGVMAGAMAVSAMATTASAWTGGEADQATIVLSYDLRAKKQAWSDTKVTLNYKYVDNNDGYKITAKDASGKMLGQGAETVYVTVGAKLNQYNGQKDKTAEYKYYNLDTVTISAVGLSQKDPNTGDNWNPNNTVNFVSSDVIGSDLDKISTTINNKVEDPHLLRDGTNVYAFEVPFTITNSNYNAFNVQSYTIGSGSAFKEATITIFENTGTPKNATLKKSDAPKEKVFSDGGAAPDTDPVDHANRFMEELRNTKNDVNKVGVAAGAVESYTDIKSESIKDADGKITGVKVTYYEMVVDEPYNPTGTPDVKSRTETYYTEQSYNDAVAMYNAKKAAELIVDFDAGKPTYTSTGAQAYGFKNYSVTLTYTTNAQGWDGGWNVPSASWGTTNKSSGIDGISKAQFAVTQAPGSPTDYFLPLRTNYNAPADVLQRIEYNGYTYPLAALNDVVANNENVAFTFTTAQSWVDNREWVKVEKVSGNYVTVKNPSGGLTTLHIDDTTEIRQGRDVDGNVANFIPNKYAYYGVAYSADKNDDWNRKKNALWYNPYFDQALYQKWTWGSSAGWTNIDATGNGYNIWGPNGTQAANHNFGSYASAWNQNLLATGLIINSAWTMQLNQTKGLEWGDSTVTFFWDDITADDKITNVSDFITSMQLITPTEWFWDAMAVEVGAAISVDASAGAGLDEDAEEVVEEEPAEEEVIEEEPIEEEPVEEEVIEEEPIEEEPVEEEPEEEFEEEEFEEETEPEVTEAAVDEEESPRTGNAPIALAVIPVALAAAAVIAKKKN